MLDSGDAETIRAAVAVGDSAAVLAFFEQQRKGCEEAIRKREREFSTLLENSLDGIIRFDHDFRITSLNSVAAGMVRGAREELIGKIPIEFPMPMHLAFLWQGGLERVYASGEGKFFEYEFDDLRTVHHLQINMVPEVGPDGTVESVLAITRDISRQQETAVALRKIEERFRFALGTMPITVYSQDGELRYTLVYSSNPMLPAEFLLGHTDQDIFPADEATRTADLKRRVMKTGEPAHVESEVTLPTGKIWLEVTVAPLFNSENEIIGVAGVALDITRRKQDDDARRQGEEMLQLALEGAGAGMWIRARDGEWQISPRQNVLFGLPPDSPPMPEADFRKYIHPDDLPRVAENWRNAILGKERFAQEYRVVWPDGSIHWVSSKGKLLENSEFSRFAGITYDITERKLAEEKLIKARDELSSILENSNNYFVSFDRNWRIMYINAKAAENVGYKPEDLIGADFWQKFPKMEGTPLAKHLRRAMHEGVSVRFTIPGEISGKLFEERAYPTSDGIALYWMDITERRKSEEVLRESERKFRELVKNAPTCIYEVDYRTKKFVSVNDAMCLLTGYSREELLSMSPLELLDDEGKEKARERYKQWEAGAIPEEHIEYTVIAKDGQMIDLILEAAYVRGEDNKLARATFIGHDITERKNIEKKIAQVRREQEAFLRHEVKNLLAPIQLFSEMLLQDVRNFSEEQVRYLRNIEETAERAAGFIDSLKRVHDIEHGRYTLKRVRQSLDAVIRKAIQNLEPLARNSGVVIDYLPPEEELSMACDPNLLPGVFINLIKNAIEHVAKLHNPAEKVVMVQLAREKSKYVIRINNRGEPVSPERLATFFEKFNAGPEKKGGTGLGTAYASLVTKAHKGDISVCSSAGEGTTVTVRF